MIGLSFGDLGQHNLMYSCCPCHIARLYTERILYALCSPNIHMGSKFTAT